MQLTINGHKKQLDEVATIAQLLKHLDIGKGKIAVELNGEIIPRSTFTQQKLKTGDQLEIVQAIGGG